MKRALELARDAGREGEVPVGAVVELDGKVIGEGDNRTIRDTDPSGHAEIVALRRAAGEFGDFRLEGGALWVTVEPCLMCLGAILNARIERLVWGCAQPKFGALQSRFELRDHPRLSELEIEGGIMADASRELLSEFFEDLRRE